MEKLIYPYQSVSFTNFNVSLASAIFEIGATSSAGGYTASWGVGGPTANWTPNSIFISQGLLEFTGGIGYTSSPILLTLPAYRYTTAASLTAFTITGGQSSGSAVTASKTYQWKHKIYWGKTGTGLSGPSSVLGLSGGGNQFTSATAALGSNIYSFVATTGEMSGYVITPTGMTHTTWKQTDASGVSFTPTTGTFTETNSNGVSITWNWYQVGSPSTGAYAVYGTP